MPGKWECSCITVHNVIILLTSTVNFTNFPNEPLGDTYEASKSASEVPSLQKILPCLHESLPLGILIHSPRCDLVIASAGK